VLPPSPPPYRTPGVVPLVRPAPRVAPVEPAAPAPRRAAPEPEVCIGDRAGEHLGMRRGRYGAWSYVVVAYLFESMLLGIIPIAVLSFVLAPFTSSAAIAGWLGMLGGAVLAWLVFRDRWRCIEAYSSRFCSGLVNLSALYVPLIALVYANKRGLDKWSQRRA
jgi:hypothetical protein